jgi:hypothetical protein
MEHSMNEFAFMTAEALVPAALAMAARHARSLWQLRRLARQREDFFCPWGS